MSVWSCFSVVTALAGLKPQRPASLSSYVNSPSGPEEPNTLMPFINAEHKQASPGTCTQTSSFVFVFLSRSLLPTLYLSGFHPFLCFLFFFFTAFDQSPATHKTLEGVEFQQ